MSNYRIDVEIDPSKVRSGRQTVVTELGAVEKKAAELESAINDALSFQGAGKGSDFIKETEKYSDVLKEATGATKDFAPVSKKVKDALGEEARAVSESRKAVDAKNQTLREMIQSSTGASGSILTLTNGFRLLGAAVGALTFRQIVNEAIEFQDKMAEISTQVDETEYNMKSLTAEAIRQAKEFGSAPLDQANAYYEIISAGAKNAADATTTLTAANKLAVGGITDTATAADVLTSVLNAYGPAAGSAADVSDALFIAVRNGKTTMEEMAASVGAVAPLASQLGVSFDELTAAMAALTSGGIKTSEAATGVRAVLAAVAKPSKEAADMAAKLGIEFTSAGIQAKGFAGFMQDIAEKTGGSQDALAIMFGGVEALVPVLAFAGQAGKNFTNTMEDMAEKAGATEAAFNKIANSPGFKLDQLMTNIKVEVIELGTQLLTVLVPAMTFVNENFDTIVDLLEVAAIAFVGYTAATIAASVATVSLSGTFGIWIGTIATAYTQLGILAAAEIAVTSAGVGLMAGINAITTAMLANPAVWFAAALAGVVLAIKSVSDANAEAETRLYANAAAAEELGIELSQASQMALKAATENNNVGSSARATTPAIWAFKSATDGLTMSLWEQAKAARAARVEMLKQKLAETQERESAAQGLTYQGARATLGASGAAFQQGDILKGASLLWDAQSARWKQVLSGGRVAQEAMRDYTDSARIAMDLQEKLNKAMSEPLGSKDLGSWYEALGTSASAAGSGMEEAGDKAKGSAAKVKDAAKEFKDYLAELNSELSKVGKTQPEIQQMEVALKALGATKAGLPDLARDILGVGAALATAKDLQAGKDFVKTLNDETAALGMNSEAAKMSAISTEAVRLELASLKAPTQASIDALLNQAKAVRESGAAWQKRSAEIKETDFKREVIEPMQAELDMLGKGKQELEKSAFQRKMIAAGIKEGSKAWLEYLGVFKQVQDRERDVKVAQDLADQFGEMANAANEAADTMASAFGRVGGAIGDVIAVLAEYGAKQAAIRAQVVAGTKTETQAQQELGNIQLDTIGQVIGSAKSMFKEHSKGYKAMAAAEKAFAVIQMANTAINIAAGAAKMFATLGPFGFPAVAAMVAVMAGLGAAVSGGGGSYKPPTAAEVQAGQGTGSVLGDSEAKSGSIDNALELMLKNTNKDLEYSSQMVTSLRAIQANIGNLTGLLARQLNISGGSFDQSGLGLGSSTSLSTIGKLAFGIPGLIGVLDDIPVIGGLLNGIAKALFGTKKTVSLLDQGIEFTTQSVADILNGADIGRIYQDIQTQTKKKFLGVTTSNKTKVTTNYGELDGDMERQIALIIGSLKTGIIDAAGILGITGAEAALDAFQVNIGKISLKDLKGDEIAAQLNAVFSKLGDDMAAAAAPGLEAFQQAGEGLFETLTRLAKNYATIDIALASIGMAFGSVGAASVEARENLINLFGSLEEFTEQTNFFRDNFLTEAERMAPIISVVTAEMGRLGFAGTTTMDQFKDLVLGLDLSTEAGAEMYASLLAVAPAFAKVVEYSKSLTDALEAQAAAQAKAAADERYGLETRLLALQGNTTSLRERELAALDPTNRELQKLIYRLEDMASAAERSASLFAQQSSIEAENLNLMAQVTGDQTYAEQALRLQREAELRTAEESLRPLLLRKYALEDELALNEKNAAAQQVINDEAEKQAAKLKAIADERYGLETQWLQLIGDQATLRARELEKLDPSNRALQQSIWDLTDAQAEAAKAAEEAAQAQQDYADALNAARGNLSDAYERETSALQGTIDKFSAFSDSLKEFRRSLFSSGSSDGAYGQLQSQFRDTARMAALGNERSFASFNNDAQAYLDAARERSGSELDYQRIVAEVARATDRAIKGATGMVSEAQQQIDLLEQTVSQFIDLNENLMTVEEAIEQLQSIQAIGDTSLSESVDTGLQELKEAVVSAAAGATGEAQTTKAQLQDLVTAMQEIARRLGSWDAIGSMRISNDEETSLFMTGDVEVTGGTVGVDGLVLVEGTVTVDGPVSVTGSVDVDNVVSVSGNVTVANDAGSPVPVDQV